MKKIIFVIIYLLLMIMIVFASLEIFLRLNPKFGYNYYSFKLLKKTEAPMLEHFKSHSLRPSAILGYEEIPNSNITAYPYGLKVNSYGMMGKEYKLKKDSNTFRILMLGDSIAWFDWSRQFLEETLNKDSVLNSKYRFEIWNASTPSYDVRRYALYLQHKGLPYKPDMVMISLFMNDFGLDTNVYYKTEGGYDAYYFSAPEVSKRLVINPFLMQYSYLYRFVILRLNSCLSYYKQAQGISTEEEQGRYYLGMIKEICDKNNIALFVVIFPYLKPLDKYETYQLNSYRSICKVVKDSKIPYINLYERLSGKDLYALRLNIQDEIHPSREGHQLIAKIIYNDIYNLILKK